MNIIKLVELTRNSSISLEVEWYALVRQLSVKKALLNKKQGTITGGLSAVQMWAEDSADLKTVPRISLVILTSSELHIIKGQLQPILQAQVLT